MITRSLEKAQKRIEELNFDARKHVLSYDDVLNVQRKSVYERRNKLLAGGNDALDEEISRLEAEDAVFADAIQARKQALGDNFYPLVRRFLLQTIDFLWVEHLEAMEYLRSSVNLRAYGQRDPLVEYKKEGLRLFKRMEESYDAHAVRSMPHLGQAAGGEREGKAVETAARAITAQGGTRLRAAYERNDKVVITNGKEEREMKFKKAEELLQGGEWRIVEK
jgi:preprotein translocase subunit SecA